MDLDRLLDMVEPEEREALAAALGGAGEDPSAQAMIATWAALRRRLGADLRRDLPDPDLLVLYALGDDPSALTPAEEARLITAQPAIEAALEAHPSLGDVVARVHADRAAFERAWAGGGQEPAVNGTAPSLSDAVAEQIGQRAMDREPARPARRWAWRAVTAVAVVAFAALGVFLVQRDAGFETVQAAEERRELSLPDGSGVVLGPGARLAFEAGDDGERRVRLTGEALFDVVPGTEPFVVETPVALATVLGTTFGVRSDDRATEVVLASGAVALTARAAPTAVVTLAPGERSRVVAGRQPEAPVQADVTAALAWTGTWYFQATPLAAIARRLADHYGVAVAAPPSLAGDPVTGAFDVSRPVEETLQTLALALGVEVEGDADGGFRFVPPGG